MRHVAKHRTVKAQVESGFRISGLIVLTLLFFVALVGSLSCLR